MRSPGAFPHTCRSVWAVFNNGAYALAERGYIDRLKNIVHGAHLRSTLSLIFADVLSRWEDHPNIIHARLHTDGRTQMESVVVRHPDAKENHKGLSSLYVRPCILSTIGHTNFPEFSLERPYDKVEVVLNVVADQNS